MQDSNQPLVILVHGFGRSKFSMTKLEKTLRNSHYNTLNWSYHSLHGGIAEFGDQLAQRISSMPSNLLIHGVGHSLGGLILRQAFALQPRTGQRLITLGTPHKGAQLIARYPKFFGIAALPQVLAEMHPNSTLIRTLARPPAEIGIIAGIQRFHPLNPISWLNCLTDNNTAHDGTVDVDSTKIDDLTDYAEVLANHSFLPSNSLAISLVKSFLKDGKFYPAKKL